MILSSLRAILCRFPQTRFLCFLMLITSLLAVQTGCSRIKEKLQRLAQTAGVQPAPTVQEPVLTAEEEKLNAALADPKLFDASAPEDDAAPKAIPFELNRSSIVSILGYHDFRDRGGDAMLINATKFREQMQAIKDSKIPVVPLNDVLEWRNGRKNLPEECIVITMDDGWVGVYTYAYPVLKELGFPFTVYLYKKYVNIGGRSMTWVQLKEMMDTGLCSVGSHSVSHDSLRKKTKRSDAEQQLWLISEFKDSKDFLEEHLKIPVTSFAYPYGNYDQAILQTGHQLGYETQVTVNGQKVTWETPLGELGRYIIHGDNDTNFKLATSFRGRGEIGSSRALRTDATTPDGKPLVDLYPRPDTTITERQPLIEARLAGIGTIVPESVSMRIAGIGQVPVQFDPATLIARYALPNRIRRDECSVTVTFKRAADLPVESVSWRFKIDLVAAYLPQVPSPGQP